MARRRHVATGHCSHCGRGFKLDDGIVREVSTTSRKFSLNPTFDSSNFFVHEAYCSEECNEVAEAAKLLTCYDQPEPEEFEFRIRSYAQLSAARPNLQQITRIVEGDDDEAA